MKTLYLVRLFAGWWWLIRVVSGKDETREAQRVVEARDAGKYASKMRLVTLPQWKALHRESSRRQALRVGLKPLTTKRRRRTLRRHASR